ncbi:MAG: TonB-dependent receptor [Deltaproteobacteria bacterium]|nr:TonB-dependent receptor [Deltaproteobacteria bacterium]
MSFKILRSLRLCGESWFILAFFFLVIFSCNVQAEDAVSEPEAYQLGEIVVTATRAETPRQDIAANITVVTREDIEKMPVSNAAEVLQYIPGVYVEFGAGLGSDTTASIQGSSTRHVAVYQDGVPLNQLLNPRTNLSYIPIDTIDRIEIYKGAASSAWGSALGGVINIITKEPDKTKPFSADVRTSYGEHRTSKSRGTVSGTKDGFGYLLSLTHDESDGFIDYTEYKQDAVYAKLNYELGTASRLNFAYSYDKGESEDPVPNWPSLWDDIDQRRSYQRLLFETSPADNLTFTLEGRHHQFDSSVIDIFFDGSDPEIYNDYEDEIWGVSARVNHTSGATNTLNLGFDEDWGRFDYLSEVWGSDLDGHTRNWAAYANDTLTVGDISLNAGLRYDDNRDFGGKFSPSCGVVYRIAEYNALVRAQVAKGFSAPDPNELSTNPNLDPEIAINYQLGVEIQPIKFLRLEVNAFRAEVDDLIDWNSDTGRYENIDEVTRRGVEGSISANFDFGLRLAFGGSYVHVTDEETNTAINDIPRKTFNVSAAYTYKWMTHSINGKYIDHNSTYPETEDDRMILDYLLQVTLPCPERHGKVSLFAAVYNLTNSNYVYRAVWPQPDRWVEGGVRFEF